jgi:predicted metal-dependent phosphoesterase TrpH
MSIIDLHAHSTRSDGKESPTEVYQHAAAAGVNVLAMTDHDTVKGWVEAAEAAKGLGLGFVPGIEVTSVAKVKRSSHSQIISVHLLAYLPDPNHEAFHQMLGDTLVTREARARNIVDRLSADIDITWEMVMEQIESGATIGRPAIADALVAMGLIENRSAAFDHYLSTDGPYFVAHDTVDVLDAISLIKLSGGVPVIAHPLTHVTENTNSEDLPREFFESMIDQGLMGLEVFHRDVPEPARQWLLEVAKKHDLIVTGSSDYHGVHGKPNRLGENSTSEEMFNRILSAGTGSAAVL